MGPEIAALVAFLVFLTAGIVSIPLDVSEPQLQVAQSRFQRYAALARLPRQED